MENIKKLFTLKKAVSQSEITDTSIDNEKIRITYFQSGYGASVKASGNDITFGVCLKNLYNSYEDQCRRQKNEQDELKKPYIEDKERVKSEIKKRETAVQIAEEKEQKQLDRIESKRFEMIDVRENPNKYGIDADKRPKAQFYIGLFLLLPITIYLFVFYISASYSAFFKDFETSSLTAAIFDADALGKATRDGWLEALFVGTIPFVFMGLGYLIHMFQKIKGWKAIIKLAVLLILTFIFDVILAYLIERKIFLYEALVGQQFTPEDAVQSVNFWGIIFAGFVVYIIWGLVFDFVMKEHENVDKIRAFINARKEEIKNLSNSIELLKNTQDEIKRDLASLQGRINEIQGRIDGFIFPIKQYLHYHYQYKEGWFQAINAEIALPTKEKDELRNRCQTIADNHLKDMDLNEMDYQNLIFTNKN
ncbi:ABC transporter permease [Jejudonia soesokkakensis]|uniref:ABC transporter permease n=1 Tax=Jejudonia soesokkakensis TaxID=1323432 RepID=A0ABW2MSB6_9FLAO